jgi:hypothetical protein
MDTSGSVMKPSQVVSDTIIATPPPILTPKPSTTRTQSHLLKCVANDIIAYHLLPLLDDDAAIYFILSSHHTYSQYYVNYTIKTRFDAQELCKYANICNSNKHRFPTSIKDVIVNNIAELKSVLSLVRRIEVIYSLDKKNEVIPVGLLPSCLKWFISESRCNRFTEIISGLYI